MEWPLSFFYMVGNPTFHILFPHWFSRFLAAFLQAPQAAALSAHVHASYTLFYNVFSARLPLFGSGALVIPRSWYIELWNQWNNIQYFSSLLKRKLFLFKTFKYFHFNWLVFFLVATNFKCF